MDLPTTYNGRDYRKVIERVIQEARTEYEYPSSASHQGMKQVLGRDFYRQLLDDKICEARIPTSLKIQYMGEKRYRDCRKARA